MVDELKKFNVQSVLVLEYKKIGDHKAMHKTFHSSTKLITNDLDINKAFVSMHLNVMTKVKNFVSENCRTCY